MRYLVVAHQTATSGALLDKLKALAKDDAEATFTLLVPATPRGQGLTWTEGGSIAQAQQVAAAARRALEQAGLRVAGTMAGDASPLQAISDALGPVVQFDAIVISTLPPGVSRWLNMDVHARAKRQFGLPVISVVASGAPLPTS
jgi:hypothetical protein